MLILKLGEEIWSIFIVSVIHLWRSRRMGCHWSIVINVCTSWRLAIIFTFIHICYLSSWGATSLLCPRSCFHILNFINLCKRSDKRKLLTLLCLLWFYWILVAFSGIGPRLMHSLVDSLRAFYCMDIMLFQYPAFLLCFLR